MENIRTAWLLKRAAFYWQPVVGEFSKLVPQTVLFTGSWPGYAWGYEESFKYKVVGQRKLLRLRANSSGYGVTLMYLSPMIIVALLKYRPRVIFADSFSFWTLIALVLKLILRWQIIVFCDGSSPNVDHLKSPLRLLIRREMVKRIDVFVVNNNAAQQYIVDILRSDEHKLFFCPFLVTDGKALQQSLRPGNCHQALLDKVETLRPVFLYVGQIIPRKGIKELLDACAILKNDKQCNYTLLIVGEGRQRQELEEYTKHCALNTHVQWIGKVEYRSLGIYFKYADVFVFPSLEDVWGMVVPEAMVFGKPVLCSDQAGAKELIIEGQNGFCFNPYDTSSLVEAMFQFISNPSTIDTMGKQAQKLSAQHTPKQTAKRLAQLVSSP